MARTDANPPMPEFRDDYAARQRSTPTTSPKAVKPKQFIHIDQAECIMCEGCVDICPWKCIHMVSPDAIDEADEHRAARRRPERPRRVHHRRRHLHPLRAVRRPLPDRRDHPRQGRRPAGATATPTPAPTATATPTACGSRSEEALVANDHRRATAIGRSWRERVAEDRRQRSRARQAWNSIFRPGLDLPQGLHRQPPQPLLRDHEHRCCTTCTR